MDSPNSASAQPRWRPISSIERRVLGVLVEKAKTTPEQYPLTVNAITTGSNQKNNRSPLMELTPDRVEEALEKLRGAGAVTEVQGSGRALKYRHMAYEWLGVDKAELAVMAELLLRGAQTKGELRGRAARMEPIADVGALSPILDGLIRKGLVIALTPAGRGQIVSHRLFEPREMEKLQAEVATMSTAQEDDEGSASEPQQSSGRTTAPATSALIARSAAAMPQGAGGSGQSQDLAMLKNEVAALRGQLSDLAEKLESTQAELESLRSALGH